MFKKLFNRLSGGNTDAPEQAEVPEQPAEAVSEAPADPPAEVITPTDQVPETTASADPEPTDDPTGIESAATPAAEASGGPVDKEEIKNRVTDMMKTIFDPEIPVNIYDIGLIYKIEPRDDGIVELVMTLTTPNCPAAGILPGEVESKARSVDGVHDVEFELTFDPPWNPDMMSEGAKLELGMM